MNGLALVPASFPPADLVNLIRNLMYGQCVLLSINGLDRVLFDVAIKRLHIEPQCVPNLDGSFLLPVPEWDA